MTSETRPDRPFKHYCRATATGYPEDVVWAEMEIADEMLFDSVHSDRRVRQEVERLLKAELEYVVKRMDDPDRARQAIFRYAGLLVRYTWRASNALAAGMPVTRASE